MNEHKLIDISTRLDIIYKSKLRGKRNSYEILRDISEDYEPVPLWELAERENQYLASFGIASNLKLLRRKFILIYSDFEYRIINNLSIISSLPYKLGNIRK